MGITTPHGVVLAVEKRVPSPLLESSSIEKIMEIDSHIGCAMSGLTADARTMVDHARVTSQSHAFTYDEPIAVESCTQAVCDLALRFGESVEDDDALMVGWVCVGPQDSRNDTVVLMLVSSIWCCPLDCWYRRQGTSTVGLVLVLAVDDD